MEEKMRIYAAADIHRRPDKIERIRNAVSEAQADVLVIAGDILSIPFR
jgi:Icc-related predicted phosphoesterase